MRTIKYLLLAISAIYFSGCLTVEENYVFKKNGSGEMVYMIDMSDMKAMLEMFGGGEGEEIPAGNPLGEDNPFNGIEDKLGGIDGIKKVKQINDEENFTFGVSFKFKHLEALNQAMRIMLLEDPYSEHVFFTLEDGVISRTHMKTNMDMLGGSEDLFGEGEEGEYAESFAQQMKYKINMEFKKNDVKAVYGQGAEVDGNTVNIEHSFFELTEDVEVLNTSIVIE